MLEQLSGQTGYIYYHLMGEPLTHPELPTFIQMANQKGFRSILTTNGTLLQSRGQALLATGLHKISISVHSFESGGALAHRQYIEQIAHFAAQASQAGTIVCLRLWNRGFDEGRNDCTLSILQELFPDAWTENNRGYRIRDRLFLEWGDRFDWPDLSAPLGPEQVFCHGMRDQFGILCDGSVVPCCLDSDGIITLGNVFQQDLIEILKSPRAQAMVQGFRCRKASEELCRHCGYARRFSLD